MHFHTIWTMRIHIYKCLVFVSFLKEVCSPAGLAELWVSCNNRTQPETEIAEGLYLVELVDKLNIPNKIIFMPLKLMVKIIFIGWRWWVWSVQQVNWLTIEYFLLLLLTNVVFLWLYTKWLSSKNTSYIFSVTQDVMFHLTLLVQCTLQQLMCRYLQSQWESNPRPHQSECLALHTELPRTHDPSHIRGFKWV